MKYKNKHEVVLKKKKHINIANPKWQLNWKYFLITNYHKKNSSYFKSNIDYCNFISIYSTIETLKRKECMKICIHRYFDLFCSNYLRWIRQIWIVNVNFSFLYYLLQNYIKSSTGGRTNISDIEGVWDIIERYKTRNAPIKENNFNAGNSINNEIGIDENTITKSKKKKTLPENNDESSENKITDASENCSEKDDSVHLNIEKPKKQKKRKSKDNEEIGVGLEDPPNKKTKISATLESNGVGETTQNGNNEVETETFTISSCISQILLKKEAVSKEKLYKKVMRKFKKFNGEIVTSDEKLQRKIDKKLKKLENVVVEDDIIKLVKK